MRTVPLRRLFERAKVLGHIDEPMLSVYRDRGVVLKDESSNPNQTAEDRSIYQLVDKGWLVVNRMKAWQGSIGVSDLRGIVSGHYICFRPTHSEDDRYLHYLLRSPKMTAHFLSISRGVRPGQSEIDNDDLASTSIDLPAFIEQRRIADFLDDRVARIDRIIAARREQIALLLEHFHAGLEEQVWSTRAVMPLKHLLEDVTSGPRGWSDLVSDAGQVPFVRIANLSRLGIELAQTNLVKVVIPDDAEAARASLQRGDVLLSITAAFGEVAVWRNGIGTFSQHVARIRPRSSADSEWIAWTLQTRSAHDQYRMQAYGGTKIGMGLEQVRNIQIPVRLPNERAGAVKSLNHMWDRTSAGQLALNRSINVLTEYKSSLITAAVTGEFDVRIAGSGIPG